ncbi:hypothetical protein F6X40_41725 [Paraburkholderia sp. UCT31]|uniref:hypothetical protein n=1 Tax=Paraburkholderia sp. UCT31 TaxID=2615209 RepID=UPI001654DDA6|nr:hypothetical protein [Paraburkholderia sp. UCT31]MBC8742975.1 hypothetical protein [Paraburkholderia sp. UCT31]
MQMLEAFRRFNAKPRNHLYDVTAISETAPPELVVALVGAYRQWMRRRDELPPNVREYRDDLRDWGASPAVNEVRGHLCRALDEALTVRLVMVTVSSANAAKIDAEPGASMRGTATDFEPRPDMLGRVTAFDGNSFTIRFERAAS